MGILVTGVTNSWTGPGNAGEIRFCGFVEAAKIMFSSAGSGGLAASTYSFDQGLTSDEMVLLPVSRGATNTTSKLEPPAYLQWAVGLVTAFSVAHPPLIGAASEALQFLAKLSAGSARPAIWTDNESEIVFEWISASKHAVVSFEGDGEYGYATKSEGMFKPGAFRGDPKAKSLPADLSDYINAS